MAMTPTKRSTSCASTASMTNPSRTKAAPMIQYRLRRRSPLSTSRSACNCICTKAFEESQSQIPLAGLSLLPRTSSLHTGAHAIN
eukprot:scaffold8329_cov277-Pinguiococcus_pyrenoidosus.AAC.3